MVMRTCPHAEMSTCRDADKGFLTPPDKDKALPCSPPSRMNPLGGLRPSLTAAVRGSFLLLQVGTEDVADRTERCHRANTSCCAGRQQSGQPRRGRLGGKPSSLIGSGAAGLEQALPLCRGDQPFGAWRRRPYGLQLWWFSQRDRCSWRILMVVRCAPYSHENKKGTRIRQRALQTAHEAPYARHVDGFWCVS